MRIHDLKCNHVYFREIWDGIKTFEVRKDDRGYLPADTLILREFFPDTETYSGRVIEAEVGYMLKFWGGIKDGYVVMSLLNVRRK